MNPKLYKTLIKIVFIYSSVLLACPVLLLLFVALFGSSNEDIDDKAEIPQNIGGVLICNSTCLSDIHTYEDLVSYVYRTASDSIINIGNGDYYGRSWEKDEQLIRVNNWIILKTGNDYGSDKIFVGKLTMKNWDEYKFTPDEIAKASIWQSLKLHPLSNICCPQTFIEKIGNDGIELMYKFVTEDNGHRKDGSRKIYYRLDSASGRPIMVKIALVI